MGGAVGNFAAAFMKKQVDEQHLKDRQQNIREIMAAPDRETALGMGAKIQFRDSADLTGFYKTVDAIHPPKDSTPKEVTTTDANGVQRKTFVKSGDLTKPGAAESIGGPGATFASGDAKDFYQPNDKGDLTLIGKRDPAKRPPGSVTLEEFNTAQTAKKEARNTQKDADSATRLDLLIESGQRAERASTRAEAAAGRSAATQQDANEIRLLTTANSLLKDRINIKKSIGENGIIMLEFGEDSAARDRYNKASDLIPDMLKKHKNPNKAVTAAMEAAGFNDKPTPTPTPAPAPANAKDGAVSAFFGKAKSTDKPPAAYPDAKKAPDGQWYVKKGDKYFRVDK